MDRRNNSRVWIAISGVLTVLLAVLAVVQYRWATRVAGADAQRTRAHLESAAGLFAREFNLEIARVYLLLQNRGAETLDRGTPLTGLPKLVRRVYRFTRPSGSPPRLERLSPAGVFVASESAAPEDQRLAERLAGGASCGSLVLDDLPALVVPAPVLFDLRVPEHRRDVLFHGPAFLGHTRCLVAVLDRDWLRSAMFPELIRRSFGSDYAAGYDFAVRSLSDPREPVYGAAPPDRNADARQKFFALRPEDLIEQPLEPARRVPEGAGQRVIIREFRTERPGVGTESGEPRTRSGLWELAVFRRGGTLESAVRTWRLQNVLVSAGVELALVAAIAFLMLSTRRMQRLADQKMQFVAGVSHELRTPVSSIAVLSRNQADGLVTGPDQVRQYGELIYQQSRRLGDMVEQTLALSGIQSGRRQPAFCSVDIRALVEEAVAVRREALARAGFYLEVDFQESLPAVHGDPRLLSTAVANLLSNAEKYANGSRWIRVAAESDPDGKEVRIHVEDHGSGIDAADRSHIFEPFYRGGGAVEAQVPGSGIGLSLVRATAEAHQGSVTFVTEPGRGSKFTLHLPARTSDAQ